MLEVPTVLAFVDLLASSDFPYWFRLTLQLVILWASLTLLYFMVRYKHKTLLDTSLFLRELAFAVLIIRLTLLNTFTLYSIFVTNATYLFLALTCILVLYAVVRTRTMLFFNRRKEFDIDEEEEG